MRPGRPVARSDPQTLPGAAAGFLRNARVLIVDDREANVRLLQAILRSAGVYDVLGLTDPRRALDRCVEFKPDVVLLDLHMAPIDGLAVLGALRDLMPTDAFLPVVVLTADVTPEARQRVLAAGANDFLTKPFDRVEVLLRVSNLLETRELYARLRQDRAALQLELGATAYLTKPIDVGELLRAVDQHISESTPSTAKQT